MVNTQAAAIVIGILMTFLITVLKQVKFPRWANLLVAIVACGGAGVLTIWATGQLSWTAANIVGTIALVFVAAQATYASFWKDSGVETVVNEKTSIFKPTPPEIP